jgi:lipopolysaccharide export system protein LptA
VKTWLAGTLFAAAIGLASPVLAQSAEALGDGPLALDAANGIEWRQQERLFIAEGDAVAKQAGLTLKADRLVASYRKAPFGKIEIFRVDAEGNVNIENQGDRATGSRAVFNLEGRKIVLTGSGLQYASGEAVVTASRTLEYDVKRRRAVAAGNARVKDRRGELTAAVIEARFGPSRALSEARASGGVVLRTTNETVRADRAIYNFKAEIAQATGNVRIARGRNTLTGSRATVNFKSGISRISGKATGTANQGPGSQRVRGMIFPKAVQ